MLRTIFFLTNTSSRDFLAWTTVPMNCQIDSSRHILHFEYLKIHFSLKKSLPWLFYDESLTVYRFEIQNSSMNNILVDLIAKSLEHLSNKIVRHLFSSDIFHCVNQDKFESEARTVLLFINLFDQGQHWNGIKCLFNVYIIFYFIISPFQGNFKFDTNWTAGEHWFEKRLFHPLTISCDIFRAKSDCLKDFINNLNSDKVNIYVFKGIFDKFA